eukprot:7876375-Ditylum_brightwellii.AAC.1
MNEPCKLYLDAYGIIDTEDQMVKKAMIRCICWKWWHIPVLHGKGIGTATSHELYMDSKSGKVVAAWKMDNLMSYHDVYLCLGEQMMTYDPKNGHYP